MSFQPIDLQLSVHRTPEQSTFQAQSAHRPMAEQQQLAEQASKETEQLRSKNVPVEQAADPQIRGDDDQRGGFSGNRQKGKRGGRKGGEEPQPQQPDHPYKGKHIDISL